MFVLALQHTEGGGSVEGIAATFGVDWVHLGAQIVSFGLVCLVLYALAYKPVLQMLAARREQIAAGLANAEKIKTELARIAAERQQVRPVHAEGAGDLLELAPAPACRLQREEPHG